MCLFVRFLEYYAKVNNYFFIPIIITKKFAFSLTNLYLCIAETIDRDESHD